MHHVDHALWFNLHADCLLAAFFLGARSLVPTSDDVRGFGRLVERTGFAIFAAPARWRVRHWAAFLGIAATTLLAYADKRPLQACVQRGGSSVARAIALFADALGGGFTLLTLGLATFVAGRWFGKRALVEATVALAVAGIWCWLFTKTGQLILAERRPKDGGAMNFFALGGHGVSGHAAAASLLFSPVRDVLARGAKANPHRLVTGALIAWAALVGWSRVWLGMHFVWNVGLGFAIGFFTGLVGTRVTRSGNLP